MIQGSGKRRLMRAGHDVRNGPKMWLTPTRKPGISAGPLP
jgi:hypothetical protein